MLRVVRALPSPWDAEFTAGRVVLGAIALWALFCLQSCSWMGFYDRPQKVNAWLAEPGDLAPVRRIAVLPFAASTGVTEQTGTVRDAFQQELAKLQRFELVTVPDTAHEDREVMRSVLSGRYSTEGVVALCERYRLDGILIGTVTAYRPYKPPHLGVQAHLLSVHSGDTVWAADALYDSADRSVWHDLCHWDDRTAAAGDDLHGSQLALISPARFARFVAHRMVATWRDEER